MKNGVMMQYFEWNLPNDGLLWKKLKEDAVNLHQLGITAVWIPPAYKASEQKNQGYAAYDLYDLGEFYQKETIRTKYGTKAELIDAIEELHKYRISVYLDVVFNHKIGADQKEKFIAVKVDPENRTIEISDPAEIEGWTQFNFSGRKGRYSPFTWHSYHFTGIEIENSKEDKHIYRITGENKHWSQDVDKEKGNFDFLMGADVDHKHPDVISELNNWGNWVVKELHLDGMRLDAIKHISSAFIHQFVDHIKTSNNPNFYFVGEYWKADLLTLENYLKTVDYSIDLFDVPLHYNFREASMSGDKYDLRKLFSNALVARSPSHAVTFVDNHDSQQGSSLESEVECWFKPLAYALILLRKDGYPCLFYGDYYGIGCQEPVQKDLLKILLEARQKYAYGEEKLYLSSPNVIGLVRYGDNGCPNSGLATLISNHDTNLSLMMNVGLQKAGEKWIDLTGSVKQAVEIGKDGIAEFHVLARNFSVWAKWGNTRKHFIGISDILKRIKSKCRK
ncbi:MAG: putative alpha-amylase precursor [Bacteroidetes bacterium]|nr:putative alpha-amylase precursor [Bacteroidota bacterium]